MPSADVTTDEKHSLLESDGAARYYHHIGDGTTLHVKNVGNAPSVIGNDVPRVGEYLLTPGMTIRLPGGRRRFFHQAGVGNTILSVVVE